MWRQKTCHTNIWTGSVLTYFSTESHLYHAIRLTGHKRQSISGNKRTKHVYTHIHSFSLNKMYLVLKQSSPIVFWYNNNQYLNTKIHSWSHVTELTYYGKKRTQNNTNCTRVFHVCLEHLLRACEQNDNNQNKNNCMVNKRVSWIFMKKNTRCRLTGWIN